MEEFVKMKKILLILMFICFLGLFIGGCCKTDEGCDDENVCTTDTCVDQSCSNVPNSNPCDDGNPCTKGDRCAGSGGCIGTDLCADEDKVCYVGSDGNARCVDCTIDDQCGDCRFCRDGSCVYEFSLGCLCDPSMTPEIGCSSGVCVTKYCKLTQAGYGFVVENWDPVVTCASAAEC